jgi:hypothetical protein
MGTNEYGGKGKASGKVTVAVSGRLGGIPVPA